MSQPYHVISVGYAGRLLDRNSREFSRVAAYATKLDSLTMLVFSSAAETESEISVGNFSVIGTQSRTKLGRLLGAVRLLRRTVQKYPAGSVIVTSQDPFMTSVVVTLARVRSRVYRHVQLHGDFYGAEQSLVNAGWRWFGRRVLRQADAIRVVSKRILESLVLQGINAARITVLPVYTDLELLLKVGQTRSYQSGGACRFLFVGRLAPEKQLTSIVAAFANVLSQNGDATLTIVGDGPERAALAAYCGVLGITKSVSFLGWQENLPAIMSEHDALVLASESEGWGMVIVEAMAAGLSIVTTDVGCVGEVMIDGVHGLVVPDVTDSLVDALLAVATNPRERERWGQNSYETASQLADHYQDYSSLWVTGVMTAQKTKEPVY